MDGKTPKQRKAQRQQGRAMEDLVRRWLAPSDAPPREVPAKPGELLGQYLARLIRGEQR